MNTKTLSLFFIFLLTALIPHTTSEAQQRYNNNNYYIQQQAQRNQQMANQQRQQQISRQQQENARRQQEQMRQQQQRQRQAMQERQRQIQAQARQRQQNAAAQRQKMAERQRIRNQKLRIDQKNKQGQLQAAQKQQVQLERKASLFEQRRIKVRKDRLSRLQKDRNKKDKDKKRKAQSKSLFAMTAAYSLRQGNTLRQQANLRPASLKLTQKNFKQQRLQQKQKTKLTEQATKLRQVAQSKLHKARLISNNLAKKTRQKIAKVATDIKNKAKTSKFFKNCKNGFCKITGGSCSFHGDTLVKTMDGYEPIKSLEVGEDWVWARNEYTGETDWKPITAHYSNPYEETVEVEIRDVETGLTQTIRSNRIHPFYVSDGDEFAEGFGTNVNGRWIQAQNLQPNYSLLTANGTLSKVSSVRISDDDLKAFNITVDEFHTYFVKSFNTKRVESVWVHNDCPTNSNTSREAFRKAKKQNQIPLSKQPDRVILPNTPEGKIYKLDNRNIKLYVFTNAQGQKVHIRQDKPDTHNNAQKGQQGYHYNAGREGEKLRQHHYYERK